MRTKLKVVSPGWLTATLAFVCLTAIPAEAQIVDPKVRREVLRARQQGVDNQTSLLSEQMLRQAEVSRLEGRVAKLERLVRNVPQQLDSAGLISLLSALELSQQADSNATKKSNQSESALGDPEQGEKDVTAADEQTTGKLPREAIQLIASDYIAALKVESLEAKIAVIESSAQLSSLERLAAKGMASGPQVKLQRLKYERAKAQQERLERQRTGLTELFPNFFASGEKAESVPASRPTQPPPTPKPN